MGLWKPFEKAYIYIQENGYQELRIMSVDDGAVYVLSGIKKIFVCNIPGVIYSEEDDFYYPSNSLHVYSVPDITEMFNDFLHVYRSVVPWTQDVIKKTHKIYCSLFERIITDKPNLMFPLPAYAVKDSNFVIDSLNKASANEYTLYAPFEIHNPEKLLARILNGENCYLDIEYNNLFCVLTDHITGNKIMPVKENISLNENMRYIFNRNNFINIAAEGPVNTVFIEPDSDMVHEIISLWEEKYHVLSRQEND